MIDLIKFPNQGVMRAATLFLRGVNKDYQNSKFMSDRSLCQQNETLGFKFGYAAVSIANTVITDLAQNKEWRQSIGKLEAILQHLQDESHPRYAELQYAIRQIKRCYPYKTMIDLSALEDSQPEDPSVEAAD